jgi:hypothetical protein
MQVRLPGSYGELYFSVSLTGVARLEASRVWRFLALCIYASMPVTIAKDFDIRIF